MPTEKTSAFTRGWQRISRRKHKQSGEGLTAGSSTEDREIDVVRGNSAAPNSLTSKKNGFVHRGMDRIRRSFRESFRRRSKDSTFRSGSPANQSPGGTPQPSGSGTGGGSAAGKAELWQPDEAAVRDGTCSFNVKYLGGVEVFESRGMQVCEGALKLLRTQRRRPVKAVLYVSGDGLRVVDQESNRGLIVDQTIEKVSFCAPDRNHDKGFAYICRDGTSRRWMCHGFHATKETGERLSHAVGCAFAVCLEKKKKRDAEAAASVQAAAGLLASASAESTSASGFTLNALSTPATKPTASVLASKDTGFDRHNAAYSSFRRQLSITERIRDPQTAIVQEPPPTSQAASALHIKAKPRPAANPLLFERQGSLRAPESSSAAAAAFRRQFSLRSYSTDSPSKHFVKSISLGRNDPIIEGDEETNWPENSMLNQFGTLPSQTRTTSNHNGFSLQSSSYTAPSSLHNGIANLGSSQSPLRIQTTSGAYCCGPQSWSETSSFGVVSGPSSRSRADEWLEQTLKCSLSLNSALKDSTKNYSELGSPPDQPPPPLPPTFVHSSTEKSPYVSTSVPATPMFSSDFSKYELPPITEGFTPTTETTVPKMAASPQNLDVFGQPVFNPLPLVSSENVPDSVISKQNQLNGSLNGYMSMQEEEEQDPFDVRWSAIAIKSSTSFQQTPSKSTNPFYNESAAVKI